MGIAAIGWKQIGDLSVFDTKEQLIKRLDEHFPDRNNSVNALMLLATAIFGICPLYSLLNINTKSAAEKVGLK